MLVYLQELIEWVWEEEQNVSMQLLFTFEQW